MPLLCTFNAASADAWTRFATAPPGPASYTTEAVLPTQLAVGTVRGVSMSPDNTIITVSYFDQPDPSTRTARVDFWKYNAGTANWAWVSANSTAGVANFTADRISVMNNGDYAFQMSSNINNPTGPSQIGINYFNGTARQTVTFTTGFTANRQDTFGNTITMSSDANTVAASYNVTTVGFQTQGVIVYQKTSNTWSQAGNFVYAGGNTALESAPAVLSGDGTVIIQTGPNPSKIKTYRKTGSTWDSGTFSDVNLGSKSVAYRMATTQTANRMFCVVDEASSGTAINNIRVFDRSGATYTQVANIPPAYSGINPLPVNNISCTPDGQFLLATGNGTYRMFSAVDNYATPVVWTSTPTGGLLGSYSDIGGNDIRAVINAINDENNKVSVYRKS